MDEKTQTEFPAILICECNSTEHQIVFDYDSEEKTVYCHIHLVKYGLFRRMKAGVKYIFGHKCKYGHWDEFIFKPEHAVKLRELADLLEK